MNEATLKQLIKDTTIDDIAENYRPVVDIIGIEKFIEICRYAMGEELYFPMIDRVLAPARNRQIKAEYDGYNAKELAEKYDITMRRIAGILRDEPMIGQIHMFDLLQ